MMQTPIIRTENLIKIYQDGTIALRGVSISIQKGEIVGLLGENGAGKTTLVKILAGILKPTDGKIYINGN
ncbi:MAG: ATP-binding cassette domain-containing protein, partial [Fervidicoccaceae archaeon]|nr:ATP-binding cassette domain-containing protein [Fervidicoccaceae archaeon]